MGARGSSFGDDRPEGAQHRTLAQPTQGGSRTGACGVEAAGDERGLHCPGAEIEGARGPGGGVTQAQSKLRLHADAGLEGGLPLSSAGGLQRRGTLSLLVLVPSCCFKCGWCVLSVPYDCSVLRAVNFPAKEASILQVQRLGQHDVTAPVRSRIMPPASTKAPSCISHLAGWRTRIGGSCIKSLWGRN